MPHADSHRTGPKVALWLDPVCPYSWNTARRLRAVAEKTRIGHRLGGRGRNPTLAKTQRGRCNSVSGPSRQAKTRWFD
jgi:predicted DsbA family dithiol-disulfide isomerase